MRKETKDASYYKTMMEHMERAHKQIIKETNNLLKEEAMDFLREKLKKSKSDFEEEMKQLVAQVISQNKELEILNKENEKLKNRIKDSEFYYTELLRASEFRDISQIKHNIWKKYQA